MIADIIFDFAVSLLTLDAYFAYSRCNSLSRRIAKLEARNQKPKEWHEYAD